MVSIPNLHHAPTEPPGFAQCKKTSGSPWGSKCYSSLKEYFCNPGYKGVLLKNQPFHVKEWGLENTFTSSNTKKNKILYNLCPFPWTENIYFKHCSFTAKLITIQQLAFYSLFDVKDKIVKVTNLGSGSVIAHERSVDEQITVTSKFLHHCQA